VHHHFSHATLQCGTAGREFWKQLDPNIRDFLLLPHSLNPFAWKDGSHRNGALSMQG
jgi:hypothetical protein